MVALRALGAEGNMVAAIRQIKIRNDKGSLGTRRT
jgi:hypothetical protein